MFFIGSMYLYCYVSTLYYQIKAWDGINAQGGRSPNFDERTVLNKRTGWKNTKIFIKAQDVKNAQSNFCLCNVYPKLIKQGVV